MQISIANHVDFYSHVYPNADVASLEILPDAGHHLHYQQKDLVVSKLAKWLHGMH